MISEETLKTMSRHALRVIGILFLWAFTAALAATSPPVGGSDDTKNASEYDLENKAYKLVCTNKVPTACERLIELLQSYDAYQKQQKEEEQERQKRQFDDSGTITYNTI